MQLFLIRHGETTWNRLDRIQGHRDPPLDATGRRQARWLGGRLKRERIELIYTSHQRRATETSRIIASLTGAPIRVDRDLAEVNLGRWEGLTPAQAKARYPKEYGIWLKHPSRPEMLGGEPMARFRRRVNRAIRQILASRAQRIAVVAHGGVLALWLSQLLRVDFDHFFTTLAMPNGALTRLTYAEGVGYLLSVNEVGAS